jgi:uncharacterized protein
MRGRGSQAGPARGKLHAANAGKVRTIESVGVLLNWLVPQEIVMIPIREGAGGVSFAVKVQPRARKNAVAGEVGEALKIALTAPPVDGRANQACIELLANLLNVPRSSITIASGETSRQKVVRVAGLPAEEVRKRLYGNEHD